MNTKEIAEKYSINRTQLEVFILRSDFEFKRTTFNGLIVMADPETVIEKFNEYLENKRIEEEMQAREEEEKKRKEQELAIANSAIYINEEKKELIERTRNRAKERAEQDLIYRIKGSRGRSIKVYPYKCVINTDVTVGSVLTNNENKKKKTIYFKDCIGIQYKRPGATLGYIQFETSADTMNNGKSNFFNENTFTFEGMTEFMDKVYEFVIGIMDETKGVV